MTMPNINITFEEGKWEVSPDPAHVKVGELFTWTVQVPRSRFELLRWELHFDRGTPFGEINDFKTSTRNSHLGTIVDSNSRLQHALRDAGADLDVIVDHGGIVGPVLAEQPGDYKYGVRLENAETEEELEDYDPRLIVSR
jgi:hypothetical protein